MWPPCQIYGRKSPIQPGHPGLPPVLWSVHGGGGSGKIINAIRRHQVVEHGREYAGTFERQANRFRTDNILGDDSPVDGPDAEDVHAGGARGSGIIGIGGVPGDLVADDHIVVENNGREAYKAAACTGLASEAKRLECEINLT